MLISEAALNTRIAISPRLATRSFLMDRSVKVFIFIKTHQIMHQMEELILIQILINAYYTAFNLQFNCN